MTVRRLLGALLTTGALILAGPSAHAASFVEAGWWTAAPVAAAPDAPADALVIQSGSNAGHPLAYAAIAYALAQHEVPRSLTLTVAKGSASTPNASLTLCPLTDAFKPAQGGAMADAPHFDCTTKATASPSADGSSYEFDVGQLGANGAVALAILPAAATDRVVIARPAGDSLATDTTAAATSTAAPSVSTDAAPAATAFDSITPVTGSSIDLAIPPAAAVAIPRVASPDSPAAVPRPAVTASRPVVASTLAATDHHRSLIPAAVFGLLLVLAAALWLSAGSSRDQEPITS